jgi:hypothetical protein
VVGVGSSLLRFFQFEFAFIFYDFFFEKKKTFFWSEVGIRIRPTLEQTHKEMATTFLLSLSQEIKRINNKVTAAYRTFETTHGGEMLQNITPQSRDMLFSTEVLLCIRESYIKVISLLRLLYDSERKRGMQYIDIFETKIETLSGNRISQQAMLDDLHTNDINTQRDTWLMLVNFKDRLKIAPERQASYRSNAIALLQLRDLLPLTLYHCMWGLSTCLQKIYERAGDRRLADTSVYVVAVAVSGCINNNKFAAAQFDFFVPANVLHRIGEVADAAIALEAEQFTAKRDFVNMSQHPIRGANSWLGRMSPELIHCFNVQSRDEPLCQYILDMSRK